jgi:hypothetical protein
MLEYKGIYIEFTIDCCPTCIQLIPNPIQTKLDILNHHEEFIHFPQPSVQNFVEAKLSRHPCFQSFHLHYDIEYVLMNNL